MNTDVFADLEIKHKSGIVGSNANGAFEASRVRPDTSFPNFAVVGKNAQVFSVHFRTESVRIAGAQKGHRGEATRFDVLVAAVSNLRLHRRIPVQENRCCG